MVIVQVFAFGKISDNRAAKKIAKAAKIDKERARKEKLEKAQAERQEVMAKLGELLVEENGAGDIPQKYANDKVNGHVNGNAKGPSGLSKGVDGAEDVPESGESATETSETSEEEMMI